MTEVTSGWRSRGYIPHFDARGAVQHVIFGLDDSIPRTESASDINAFDTALDLGLGACLLACADCAMIVQSELLRSDGDQYRLLAWCVMPNHVHVVLEQDSDLAGIVRRWKSWTAREVNRATGQSGRLWRREYYDRFARTHEHLQTMVNYVEANPAAAGLVNSIEAWRWSSVRFKLGADKDAGQAPGGPNS